MSKNQTNEEVDLLEVFLVIWNRKLIITLVVLASLIVTFIYKSFNKVQNITTATTEIRPISVYEEAKYKIYNLYMETIRSDYEGRTEINKEIIQIGDEEFEFVDKVSINLEINNINKKFLLDLFIERLSQKPNLANAIKEFGFLKREDYPDKSKYDKSAMKLANAIKILNIDSSSLEKPNNSIIIQYKTTDAENWENFLKFIEKQINIEIQERLSQMLNNYISYVKTIKNFEIEDIDSKISVASTEEERINLERKKKILIQDKYIDRIQNIFNSSPLSKSEEFYAAKIIHNSTNYETENMNSSKISYPLAGLFAAIIAIFVVLITNAIQNRK